MWWIWHGAKRPPTLRRGQTTRAVSPPVGCHTHHHHLLLLLGSKADTHFTIPWRVDLGTAVRVCSPRLYISQWFLRKTCNCPQLDSNLGSLTPQSGMLPLDHCDLKWGYDMCNSQSRCSIWPRLPPMLIFPTADRCQAWTGLLHYGVDYRAKHAAWLLIFIKSFQQDN